jgi:hypothetical protein
MTYEIIPILTPPNPDNNVADRYVEPLPQFLKPEFPNIEQLHELPIRDSLVKVRLDTDPEEPYNFNYTEPFSGVSNPAEGLMFVTSPRGTTAFFKRPGTIGADGKPSIFSARFTVRDGKFKVAQGSTVKELFADSGEVNYPSAGGIGYFGLRKEPNGKGLVLRDNIARKDGKRLDAIVQVPKQQASTDRINAIRSVREKSQKESFRRPMKRSVKAIGALSLLMLAPKDGLVDRYLDRTHSVKPTIEKVIGERGEYDTGEHFDNHFNKGVDDYSLEKYRRFRLYDGGVMGIGHDYYKAARERLEQSFADLDSHNYAAIDSRAKLVKQYSESPSAPVSETIALEAKEGIKNAKNEDDLMLALNKFLWNFEKSSKLSKGLEDTDGNIAHYKQQDFSYLRDAAQGLVETYSAIPKGLIKDAQFKQIVFGEAIDTDGDGKSGLLSAAAADYDFENINVDVSVGAGLLNKISFEPAMGVDYKNIMAHETGHASRHPLGKYKQSSTNKNPLIFEAKYFLGGADWASIYGLTGAEDEEYAEVFRKVVTGANPHPDSVRNFESGANAQMIDLMYDLESQYPGFTDVILASNKTKERGLLHDTGKQILLGLYLLNKTRKKGWHKSLVGKIAKH